MFETSFLPRISETNGAGHIDNTTIPVWFEVGRRACFERLHPDMDLTNWHWALVGFSVAFKAEMFVKDPVTVKTRIARIGSKSLTFSEEIWQNGRLCATGEATFVSFNYTTRQSEVITEPVRQKLESFMAS